jgi:oligopeptide/dipeptide ABC transporter ATP-binding protein
VEVNKTASEDVLIRVENLYKYFPARTGVIDTIRGRKEWVHAVDNVSFEIKRGEVFCLVGESGCGKTTTARALIRLDDPTDGRIFFEGENIANITGDALKALRLKMQMIFQDPYTSTNPRMTIYDSVAEPLVVHKLASGEELMEKVAKALESVELTPPEMYMYRYPHELSGGQRQRVGIARALILDPEFIVADEPVSMVDVSLRAGILNLLLDLKNKYNLTYVFITHNLAQAKYIGSRIAVMYLGKIVELGDTEETFEEPLHPYTKALVSNVPIPDPDLVREKMRLKGEIPTAINPPKGCRLHPRCPYASDVCGIEEPAFTEVKEGHFVACHLVSKDSVH